MRQLVLELLDVVNVFNLVLDVHIHRLHVEFEDYRGVILLFSESELFHFIQNLNKIKTSDRRNSYLRGKLGDIRIEPFIVHLVTLRCHFSLFSIRKRSI